MIEDPLRSAAMAVADDDDMLTAIEDASEAIDDLRWAVAYQVEDRPGYEDELMKRLTALAEKITQARAGR